ncbi:hypothetical protein ACROYT_G022135 [Oculina patagonica]
MMSIFLFSTFYLLIWPSLALDGLSQQEYKGDVDKNLHRSSKITTHCICGLFSLKCCRRKSTLKKPQAGFTPLTGFEDRLAHNRVNNTHQVPQNDTCICGVTSVKCCGKKQERDVRSFLWQ